MAAKSGAPAPFAAAPSWKMTWWAGARSDMVKGSRNSRRNLLVKASAQLEWETVHRSRNPRARLFEHASGHNN